MTPLPAPEISVIIPAYNTADYLDRTLRNIAEEQFGDSPAELWEIIVVNDGSTDRTEAIAQEWAGRYPGNVRVITQPNQGVSAARNRGIDKARGEYIYFMDSDDLLRQRALPDLVRSATAGRLDMLAFNYSEITPDQYKSMEHESLSHVPLPTPAPMTAHKYLWLTFGFDYTGCIFSVWRAVYHRKFLNNNRLRFDSSLSFGEDQIFNFILFSKKPTIALIPEKLYLYNIGRPLNVTSNTNKEHLDRKILGQISLIRKLHEIKETYRKDPEVTNMILASIDAAIKYLYQISSIEMISADKPFKDLIKMRRLYKNTGGKVSPGKPRFKTKPGKYTLQQRSKRWILAYPLSIFMGLFDCISGKGLWRTRQAAIDKRSRRQWRRDTVAKNKQIYAELIMNCPAKKVIFMSGPIEKVGYIDIIKRVIEENNITDAEIMVFANGISNESEITLINAGYYPFDYSSYNFHYDLGPGDRTHMLCNMAHITAASEIFILPTADISDDIYSKTTCKITSVK